MAQFTTLIRHWKADDNVRGVAMTVAEAFREGVVGTRTPQSDTDEISSEEEENGDKQPTVD